MTNFLLRIDDVLRRGRWTTSPRQGARALAWLGAFIVLFGLIYGGLMGSYRGFLGDPFAQVVAWQALYSALKVPLLLTATFLISLPAFFVLNTLFGLRDDFPQAIRALAATQAGLSIILASLGPLTLVWYATCDGYREAILFNASMFAVASFAAQWLLRGYYRPLVAKDARHGKLLGAWLAVYAFVGIQMGWVLRPFVGSPDSPVQFFRERQWDQDNAYVVVARLIWGMFGNGLGG